MIGGTRVDQVTHASSHEEPIWLKYLTLPFALWVPRWRTAAMLFGIPFHMMIGYTMTSLWILAQPIVS